MFPLSFGSMMSTSGWTPLAMRVHAGQVPQASMSDDSSVPEVTGWRQFSACAVAMAAMRLPTPDGPAKMRLGGSDCRATDRESNPMSVRCPVMVRNGMREQPPASYHRSWSFFFPRTNCG